MLLPGRTRNYSAGDFLIAVQWAVALLLLAGAAALYVLPRMGGSGPQLAVREVPQVLQGSRMVLAPGGPSRDTVFLFTDFRCPFCRKLANQLTGITDQPLSVVVRLFPARDQTQGVLAAKMAFCADRFGYFRLVHDLLFLSEEIPTLAEVAETVGIQDLDDLDDCVADPATADALQADLDAALTLGVTGTPTALYQNTLYLGVDPILRIIDG